MGGSDHGSAALQVAARGGLAVFGVMHLVFAYVAVRLVFSGESGSSTGTGALAQLAEDAAGRVTLAVVALGLVALVAWQLATAAAGYRRTAGAKRWVMRFGALSRAVVYGYLAVSAARLVLQGGSGANGDPDSTSARLLSLPAGVAVLTGAGLVVMGVGIGQAIFGLSKRFLNQLDHQARHQDRRVPIVVIGQVGYLAKGIALAVVGGLLCWAALTHDPKKSGGLDAALLKLLGGGWGRVAVVVVAVGIGLFGLYTLIRARHLASDGLVS